MLLDNLDKKLVYLLDINSREQETVLANKLGVDKQLISYRLKKLVERGIIKQFQGALNIEALNKPVYASVYFRVKGDIDSMLPFFIHQSNVGYVARIGGDYDVSIILVGERLESIDEQIQSLVNQKPGSLGSYIIQFRVKAYKFPKNYLVSKSFQTHLPKDILRKHNEQFTTDSLDKNILLALAENSRVKTIEIARKLKIAFSTIRQRIQRLLESGLIEGFTTLLDLDKLGMLNYKLLIQAKTLSKTDTQRLYQFAYSNPNVTWFFKTFGPYQFEMRVEVESQKEFQTIVQNLRSEFQNIIEHVESVMVFEELKEDYSVALN